MSLENELNEGRFTLLRKLGEGGMGEVWLARDELLRRPVALKRIQTDKDDGSLEREARALAALHHPNIVSVYDIVPINDERYLAMEFIDGRSLASAIREDGPLPEEAVRSIGVQVAEALAFAHAHGVLHNDVKPANVLLDSSGKAHLTDFGVALNDQATASLARTRSIMGTVTYLAPELFDGAPASPASEQYALATTLFEALTGRPPFPGGGAGVAQRLYRPAPGVRSVAPTVSDSLERALARALSLRPADRFASLGQFAGALRDDVTERIAVVPSARRSGRRWPAAVAAVLAVLLGAGALWQYESRGSAGNADSVFAGQPKVITPAAPTSPPAATPTLPAAPPASAATPPPPTATPNIRVVVAPPSHDEHPKNGKAGGSHGKDH
jgi:serine/threonine protein kinase